MADSKGMQPSSHVGKSFISQSFSFGLVQLISRFRGIISLSILTRLIGLNGYGLLSPLLALASIIPAFILLGANTGLSVYIVGSPPEQRRREFWGIAQLTILFSLTATLLLGIFFPFIQKTLLPPGVTPQLFVAAMLIIPISALQLVLYAQIVNNRQGQAYSRAAAFTSIIDLIVLGLSAHWFGLIGALYASVVSQSILCILMIWIVQIEDKYTRLSLAGLPDLGKYYRYGLPIFLAGFGAWVIQSSDRFIIAKYLPTEQLGIYQVAYGLCLQLNELAVPVFAPLLPFLIDSIKEGNPGQAQRYMAETLKMLLFVFLPAVILLSANARDLIGFIATSDFARGAYIVPFVAAGIALWQIVGVFAYNLHAHKAGQVLVVSVGLAALLNVVLNIVFIPIYGLIVAALSTLAAYLLHFTIIFYFSQRRLKATMDAGFILKLVGASLAMLMATLYTQHLAVALSPFFRLLISILIGGGVYLVSVYLLKLYSSSDIAYVFSSLKASLIPIKEK